MQKKIIIWGYPLYSHTQSYIHYAWFKAFKSLGYETYWFDDNNYPSPDAFDYSNSIFITEGYADKNVPLLPTETYFCHFCRWPEKYLGRVGRLIDMRHYVDYQDDINYKYDLKNEVLENIGPLCFFSKNADYDKFYVTWGTSLLPEEINIEDAAIPRGDNYYHIGTLSFDTVCNYNPYREWQELCRQNNINFIHIDPWIRPASIEDHKKITQQSIMTVDLRGSLHISMGYIAGRIFENISYGQLGMSNSPTSYNKLEKMILHSPDTKELFYLGLEKNKDISLIQDQMRWVQKNHTFVNRAKSLLTITEK